MLNAVGWKRRAMRLREAARLERDPVQRRTLLALAKDCEAIATRQRQSAHRKLRA
jgi:hypothetical protein